MDINQATSIPGTTNILVTAEDGLTQTEYSVSFDYSIGLDKHENQKLFI